MSYILDALKRADIERERGSAPGVHARHQPLSELPSNPDVSRRSVTISLLVGTILAALAAGAWVWRTPPSTPAAATLPPEVTTVASPPAAQLPVTSPRAVAVPNKSPVAPTAKALVMAPPRSTVEKVAAPPVLHVSAAAEPVAHASVVSAKPTGAVLLFDDLPQDIRSQIPKINITGTIAGDAPNQQLLLVNNLVLSQGNPVAPEVILEEIQSSSSVFNFRGTRFRVSH